MALLVDTLIPFAADGHVDPGAARAHALWLLGHGVDGFAVGASEAFHVDRKEKERILEVVADVGRGRPILFPIWDPSPAYVVKLGRVAADRGATAALLPTPLFLPVSEDGVVEWFRSVAEHVPIPVVAWHHPRFGNPLTPRILARLKAETALGGFLDASGDAHRVRRLAEVWSDTGWAAIDDGMPAADLDGLAPLPALAGGVSRLANAWPDLVRRAWVDREPGLAEAVARRSAAVDRAGGLAALKRTIGVGARLPVAGVDVAEADELP
ncbi:MAG: dihydrodipicolinate synthase family protein, partial [Myxococcota bacterium]